MEVQPCPVSPILPPGETNKMCRTGSVQVVLGTDYRVALRTQRGKL